MRTVCGVVQRNLSVPRVHHTEQLEFPPEWQLVEVHGPAVSVHLLANQAHEAVVGRTVQSDDGARPEQLARLVVVVTVAATRAVSIFRQGVRCLVCAVVEYIKCIGRKILLCVGQVKMNPFWLFSHDVLDYRVVDSGCSDFPVVYGTFWYRVG